MSCVAGTNDVCPAGKGSVEYHIVRWIALDDGRPLDGNHELGSSGQKRPKGVAPERRYPAPKIRALEYILNLVQNRRRKD
jgi:hypothetical protein